MTERDEPVDLSSESHPKHDLLVKIRDASDSLMAVLEPLDDQTMVDSTREEDRSVKDSLAQIAAWEEFHRRS